MINKDTYRQVQIAILSDIAEYKDDNEKEVWWEDNDGKKITIELFDDERFVIREYYKNGKIKWKRNFKYGKLDGESVYCREDGIGWWTGNYKYGKLI